MSRRAAVLGHPVGHSLSPTLHRAAYAHLGMDWSYDAIDVTAEDLGEFLDGLGPEWVGLSLTMPLKAAVLDLLQERDADVELVGACNTVLLAPAARRGANTDIAGFVDALSAASPTIGPEATLLGGGATARSALAALARHGVRSVQAFVRTDSRDLAAVGERVGVEVRTAAWADAQQALTAPLVVSTVPAGATDGLAHAVTSLPGLLFDVVYAPWPTRLAARWLERGGSVLSGLDLLVHQAAEQVRLMTGSSVPVAVLREALAGPADGRTH